jgi:hypothetical protein
MSAYADKGGVVPETRNVSTGSSKRDIVRRSGAHAGSGRKTNASGQVVDDGSMYSDAPSLNDRDPNYDSEVFLHILTCTLFCCLIMHTLSSLFELPTFHQLLLTSCNTATGGIRSGIYS